MFVFIALITLTFLFFLSAFWSLAETALTSLSKYRIRKIIALNKGLAQELRAWLKSPYYILTTVLISDTITSLGISFLAMLIVFNTVTFVDHRILEFATWLVVTFLCLVFGEITPKLFARFNPEKVTLRAMPLLSWLVRFARPFIFPFAKLTRILFPRIDMTPVSRLTLLSVEEITGLIKEANTSGVLGKETSQMLQRALGFGEMNVSQIMTPLDKIEAVNLDQDMERFLDLVVETGRSRVPVYHGTINNITGCVYVKDILANRNSSAGALLNSFIRPAYFVTMEKKVADLLKDFQGGQVHMALVNDSFGELAGLVTLEDILEELVGEILDEYDLKKDK